MIAVSRSGYVEKVPKIKKTIMIAVKRIQSFLVNYLFKMKPAQSKSKIREKFKNFKGNFSPETDISEIGHFDFRQQKFTCNEKEPT